MIQAYQQRAERDGIVYKQISFDFPIEDDDVIVKAYEQAITPRTKLIHVTHMVNWVGQTMPVAKIADMAHAHNIEVIADGRTFVRAAGLQDSRPALRLLWNQSAQVSFRADWDGDDVGEGGED